MLRSEAGASNLYQQVLNEQQGTSESTASDYLRQRATESKHYGNNAHLSSEDAQASNHVIYMDAASLYPSSGKFASLCCCLTLNILE